MLKLSKNEKERVDQHRTRWIVIFGISIILNIIIDPFAANGNDLLLMFNFVIIGWLFPMLSFAFFINSLFIKFKEYNYNEIKIGIYVGFYHHYLKINGIKCDEYNTLFSLTPIKLSTVIENNIKIEATISTSNAVSVKVNDILIEK